MADAEGQGSKRASALRLLIAAGVFLALGAIAATALRFEWSLKAAEVSLPDLRGTDELRFLDCARPTGVERSACVIGSSALYTAKSIEHRYPDYPAAELFKAFAAIEAANYVRFNLSPARYGYLNLLGPGMNSPTSEICLAERAGICGNHAEAFIEILSALGIEARRVGFYNIKNAVTGGLDSHAAAEAKYLGKWNYFDVTWGIAVPNGAPFIFKSIEEIRRDGATNNYVSNPLDAWLIQSRINGYNPADHLTDKTLDVIVSGAGTINLTVPKQPTFATEFVGLPSYIGDLTQDGKFETLDYAIRMQQKYRMTLTPRENGVGCLAEGSFLVVGGERRPVHAAAMEFDVEGDARITIESKSDICYVVFKSINFTALP